jgi:hypothetical protein
MPSSHRTQRAHADLSAYAGSVLTPPTARPATTADITQAENIIDTATDPHWPLIEPLPNGTLTRVDLGSGYVLIALATSADRTAGRAHVRTVTAITCTDPVDADAIYAHAAATLGLLTETCAECDAPIPSVYQVCRPDCT